MRVQWIVARARLRDGFQFVHQQQRERAPPPSREPPATVAKQSRWGTSVEVGLVSCGSQCERRGGETASSCSVAQQMLAIYMRLQAHRLQTPRARPFAQAEHHPEVNAH